MLDSTLLLATDSARLIYAEIENLPVYDIHTHVDLNLVLANDLPPDPWTALCHGDHYVTSIIESLGALSREKMFSPGTDPYEKWCAYAAVFPDLIGNQIRDWMRLTLGSLGVDLPFNTQNARAIWEQLSETLKTDRWRPRGIFQNSTIHLMATTDHPVDSLDAHRQAAAIYGPGYWIPAWRPDSLFNLLPGRPIKTRKWKQWLEDLSAVTDRDLDGDFKAFKQALADRHDHFAAAGCRMSDYGMLIPYGHKVSEKRAAAIYENACRGKKIGGKEAADFLAHTLRYSMEMDFEKNWISQIHYGPMRQQRQIACEWGGLDSGTDLPGGYEGVTGALHDLLNHFDGASGRAHKIFLYTLSKGDWEKIAGLARVFPSVYAGMSWWYFDSISGMTDFFRTMPDMGAGLRKIGPFVTDARNLYSLAPRTQIYRRCLAKVLAEFVEQRGDPLEEAISLARQVCVDEPKRLLNGE